MEILHDPFSKNSDFLTEFGNDGVAANFKWKKGVLELQKLAKGWGPPHGGLAAGEVQTEAKILNGGATIVLDFKPLTNTVGNPQATDECSSTLLNFQAAQAGLPATPAIDINTYGFSISGGKAAIQNAYAGGQVFGELQAGTSYRVVHTIVPTNGNLVVLLFGGSFSGLLGYIDADFRGYSSRLQLVPYFTDTIQFIDMKAFLF